MASLQTPPPLQLPLQTRLPSLVLCLLEREQSPQRVNAQPLLLRSQLQQRPLPLPKHFSSRHLLEQLRAQQPLRLRAADAPHRLPHPRPPPCLFLPSPSARRLLRPQHQQHSHLRCHPLKLE